MKKNDLIDFVLEHGSSPIVRGLGRFGKEDRLVKITEDTTIETQMDIIVEGNLPYLVDSDVWPIYTTDEILGLLRIKALAVLKSRDPLEVKNIGNLLHFGLDQEGKLFGSSFFVFNWPWEGKPTYDFSTELLRKMLITRDGPEYLLKYTL